MSTDTRKYHATYEEKIKASVIRAPNVGIKGKHGKLLEARLAGAFNPSQSLNLCLNQPYATVLIDEAPQVDNLDNAILS